MTEVASELIRFGFENLDLHKTTAQCNSENYGSYRVMERNGMKREGHFIDYKYGRVANEQKWYSSYFYGILKDEWVKANGETQK